MADASEIAQYQTAHLALDAILVLPSLVLWSCSLCLIRSRRDPVRKWTVMFKTAFFLFLL